MNNKVPHESTYLPVRSVRLPSQEMGIEQAKIRAAVCGEQLSAGRQSQPRGT